MGTLLLLLSCYVSCVRGSGGVPQCGMMDVAGVWGCPPVVVASGVWGCPPVGMIEISDRLVFVVSYWGTPPDPRAWGTINNARTRNNNNPHKSCKSAHRLSILDRLVMVVATRSYW